MKTLHRHINAKATGIKRYEEKIGRKATVIEIQRVLLEWYGAYFKF
jgi:hypothetical protein